MTSLMPHEQTGHGDGRTRKREVKIYKYFQTSVFTYSFVNTYIQSYFAITENNLFLKIK